MVSYILKIVLLIFATFTVCAQAKDQSNMETVRVIIPYSATSGVAQFFRILQDYGLRRNINLVPDFRPGAESMVGLNYAANGTHDVDRTIVYGVVSDVTLRTPARRFQDRDFIPVSVLTRPKVYIVAHKDVPVNNLQDLFAVMKSDPGKFSWAITNPRFYENLKIMADYVGVKPDQLVISNFNGPRSAPLVAGGHIDLAMYPAVSVLPYLNSKQVKLLGTARRQDAPAGIDSVDNYTNKLIRDGYGMFLLSGAKDETVNFWKKFARDFVADSKVKEQFEFNHFVSFPDGEKDLLEMLKIFNQGTVSLTRREEEVLGLIRIRGLSNRQISEQLGIGESAVKLHVGQILKKYHLRSRTQLAAVSNTIG
jgi:tripartite-type tricarboxylate transporter receptor subunit TctC/DNA-binding CsgD family transcriptional regulator